MVTELGDQKKTFQGMLGSWVLHELTQRTDIVFNVVDYMPLSFYYQVIDDATSN